MDNPLTAVVILFGAALAVAWLMRALRAPSILGFILAGIVIGPSGLHLIHDGGGHGNIHFFAELGLVLLLFTIGLELSPTPLIRMGLRLVVAAGLQMVTVTAVTALGLSMLLSLSTGAALIGGIAVALSSTAIVLKHLSDRGLVDTPAGSVTTGVLLLQDIAVILVLVLLPLFGQAAGSQAHWTTFVFKTLLALGGLALVTAAARLLMPVVVRLVFRHGGQELMTLFAIVMACMGAWLASLADWSWPLGSFIAGLLLAQTDLRHQLHAEITPFRDAFNALFFISIGMLVDLAVVSEYAGALTVAILATLIVKTLLTGGAVMAGGWPFRLALTAGLGLCTISEFGYVLVNEAVKLGMVPDDFLRLMIAWTVGTMLLGALFVPLAGPLATALSGGKPEPASAAAAHGHGAELSSHVIIVGYGLNGRNLATVLRATRIPHIVVEMNRNNAENARRDGTPVIVGDGVRSAILQSAALSTARALVVCVSDLHATRRIVAQVHAQRPDLYILARTRHIAELDRLYRLGAGDVIPEEFETSIEIFAHVLKEFGIPDNVIEQQVKLTRAGHYGMLRGRTAADRKLHVEWLRLLEATVTQTFMVFDNSPACGRTLSELDLRARTGVTVVAVTRGGKPTPNPPRDFRFDAGDVLVLVGTHHQLDKARVALSPPEPEPEPVAAGEE